MWGQLWGQLVNKQIDFNIYIIQLDSLFGCRRLHHLQLIAHVHETSVDNIKRSIISQLHADYWRAIICTEKFRCPRYSQELHSNCTQTALKIVHDGRNLKSVNCETLTPPVEVRILYPQPIKSRTQIKVLFYFPNYSLISYLCVQQTNYSAPHKISIM